MNFAFKVCFISLLIALPSASFAEAKSPESIKGTTRVSAEQVIELINSKADLVVIDARKSSDRSSAGWIESSVPLPDYDTDASSLAKVIPNKSTPVLFYCNGVKCGRSVKSSKIAVDLGYSEIYWFRGGWEEWISKGFPVQQ